jgi:hypothetical protein
LGERPRWLSLSEGEAQLGQRIRASRLLLLIAPAVAIVVGVHIVADAVAIGVAPLIWIQRESVPGHAPGLVQSVAIEVEFLVVGGAVAVVIVPDAIGVIIRVHIVPDEVAVLVLPLVRLQREGVLGIGDAIVVIVIVGIVGQAVVVNVRRPLFVCPRRSGFQPDLRE